MPFPRELAANEAKHRPVIAASQQEPLLRVTWLSWHLSWAGCKYIFLLSRVLKRGKGERRILENNFLSLRYRSLCRWVIINAFVCSRLKRFFEESGCALYSNENGERRPAREQYFRYANNLEYRDLRYCVELWSKQSCNIHEPSYISLRSPFCFPRGKSLSRRILSFESSVE